MIIRVFPRRTRMTPVDDLVIINKPPGLFDKADKVYISVAFTWDIPRAEKLAYQWRHVAPVEIGGPVFNQPGGQFIPGMFVKTGATITSRGCHNKCWFCKVWKREPEVKEFKVIPGNNILDDNLLACSEGHIRAVFDMLKDQKQVEFTGGLEAAQLKQWHVNLLSSISLKQAFFAYDTADDLESLQDAGSMLLDAGISKNKLRCYVLCGYKKDTEEKAFKRMVEAWKAGFLPFAMLYKGDNGNVNKDMRKFQRRFTRPAITKAILKETDSDR